MRICIKQMQIRNFEAFTGKDLNVISQFIHINLTNYKTINCLCLFCIFSSAVEVKYGGFSSHRMEDSLHISGLVSWTAFDSRMTSDSQGSQVKLPLFSGHWSVAREQRSAVCAHGHHRTWWMNSFSLIEHKERKLCYSHLQINQGLA